MIVMDSSESVTKSLVLDTVDCDRKSNKRTTNYENKPGKKHPRIHSDDEHTQILPVENERSFQKQSTGDENCPLSKNLSEKLCLSDISTSNPLNDLISFKNLEQSLVIQSTDNLQQDQSDSLESSYVLGRKKSSFKSSYIFRNLLHSHNSHEAEEFSCEQRIFQSQFPADVPSEDELIFRDIRNIFESEGKLKNSTDQTKPWIVQQTVDKDVLQEFSNLDNQNCYDWDKFLERWDGEHVISSSTSKAQHHELEKEHDSTRKYVLPSFEKEKEIIVHQVSSDNSETNTPSMSEKFITSTDLKLLEEDPIPPFIEKFISLDLENLPNRTNDSYEMLHVDAKDIIDLLTSDTNDSDDEIKELADVDGDPNVFDDPKMIS